LLLGAVIATVVIVIGFLLIRLRQRKHHPQAT
jgi:uncharacterized membrane-anchored protein YhcB (DUF1043 family)